MDVGDARHNRRVMWITPASGRSVSPSIGDARRARTIAWPTESPSHAAHATAPLTDGRAGASGKLRELRAVEDPYGHRFHRGSAEVPVESRGHDRPVRATPE